MGPFNWAILMGSQKVEAVRWALLNRGILMESLKVEAIRWAFLNRCILMGSQNVAAPSKLGHPDGG